MHSGMTALLIADFQGNRVKGDGPASGAQGSIALTEMDSNIVVTKFPSLVSRDATCDLYVNL